MSRARLEVGVVGAGPVGLFAALLLVSKGVRVTLFEKRPERGRASRSIGVHPPSLELFDALGLASRLRERGVVVSRGRAYRARLSSDAGNGEHPTLIGAIAFDGCPGPHRYVLAIPQHETERLLEGALEERAAPGQLTRAAMEVRTVEAVAGGVRLDAVDAYGARHEARFDALLACDGKRSAVREALAIGTRARVYEGRYAMADFPDTTRFGADAAVFVGRSGLVEAFPLPEGWRRWVARLDPDDDPGTSALVRAVRARTGVRLDPADAVHPSAFLAERAIAHAFAAGAVALAGDAAHVVSPIGGQGMNLGWLGARSIVDALVAAGDDARARVRSLREDGLWRQRIARAAARRAELNMWLGRPTDRPALREPVLRALLRRPFDAFMARAFTMRGLALGV